MQLEPRLGGAMTQELAFSRSVILGAPHKKERLVFFIAMQCQGGIEMPRLDSLFRFDCAMDNGVKESFLWRHIKSLFHSFDTSIMVPQCLHECMFGRLLFPNGLFGSSSCWLFGRWRTIIYGHVITQIVAVSTLLDSPTTTLVVPWQVSQYVLRDWVLDVQLHEDCILPRRFHFVAQYRFVPSRSTNWYNPDIDSTVIHERKFPYRLVASSNRGLLDSSKSGHGNLLRLLLTSVERRVSS